MCHRYERENRSRRFLSPESAAMRSYLVADARKRGTPINKRHDNLPTINQQYDTAISQWQKINDELEGDKGLGSGAQAHDGGQVALTLSRCHSSLSLWFGIHVTKSLLRPRHCQPTLKAGKALIRATACGCICSNLATSSRVRVSSSIHVR